MQRAKNVFGIYRPDWTDVDFEEAEVLVSGVEYATFMTAAVCCSVSVKNAKKKMHNIKKRNCTAFAVQFLFCRCKNVVAKDTGVCYDKGKQMKGDQICKKTVYFFGITYDFS